MLTLLLTTMAGLAGVPLPGQAEEEQPWKLRGYVEDTLTAEYSPALNSEVILNATRARLSLSGEPDPALSYRVSAVGTLYQGATTVALARYLPEDTELATAEVPFVGEVRAEELLQVEMTGSLWLQEASATLHLGAVHLSAGRQRYWTGSG